MKTNTVVRADNLTIRFARRKMPDIVAVRSITLEVGETETVALVGESGSGKTTMGRALVRLLRPSAGTLWFRDQNVTTISGQSLRRYHSQAQLIFQDPFGSLNPFHTVEYHLQRPLMKLRGVSGRGARDAVSDLLAQVGLTPTEIFRGKYPHELSGGQRQRVAIARALAGEPAFVVADEPVSMLDVSLRAEILTLLESLQQQRHLSYLYITHDLASARYLAHRIAVMYGATIVEMAKANTVVRAPAHPYTQLLLAASVGTGTVALPETESLAPDLSASRIGCPFAPRCPQVMDRCWVKTPKLIDIEPGHATACFLYQDAESDG